MNIKKKFISFLKYIIKKKKNLDNNYNIYNYFIFFYIQTKEELFLVWEVISKNIHVYI
jgi:hypothetical protein